MDNKVIILMGSGKDLEFCNKITRYLSDLGLSYVLRVASAHKTPEKVLRIIKEYEKENIVYITVAGRSNALSAFVDANSSNPVIACPPYSEKYGGADLYSSLRVPSGIGSVVTIEAEGAAIAAAKILSINNEKLKKRVIEYQKNKKDIVEESDNQLRK